jgi:N-acetylneuraminic acid mutarotase
LTSDKGGSIFISNDQNMRVYNILCFVYLFAVISPEIIAQNVGIGTNTPQRKLHVSGGVRIDTLAGSDGVVIKNADGDLSALDFSGNSTDVLKGDGSFGPLNGITPSSGVITSNVYNNSFLLNAGYSLIGEIPQVLTYTTSSSTFPANTWQPTYTRGIVSNVSAPAQIYQNGFSLSVGWNGSLMYVFDVTGVYAYNPDTDTWAFVNPTISYAGAKVIWTGTEFLLLDFNFSEVKRFNPATNLWSNASTVNKPGNRHDYSAIWNGSRLIVWGGASGTSLNTGGMYDPSTDTWTTMSLTSVPAARMKHTAVWNTATNRMIVWGGSTSDFSGEMNSGGFFDPVTNTWTGVTSTTNAPSIRSEHTAVWTGTEMIVFGGQFNVGVQLNTGGRYNPLTDTWTATSTAGASALYRHAAIWANNRMYISGGVAAGTTGSPVFYEYNPTLNSWIYLTSFGESKFGHECFSKSNMIISWGGKQNNITGAPSSNTGFRYFLTNSASSATTITSQTLYLYQKN